MSETEKKSSVTGFTGTLEIELPRHGGVQEIVMIHADVGHGHAFTVLQVPPSEEGVPMWHRWMLHEDDVSTLIRELLDQGGKWVGDNPWNHSHPLYIPF